MSEMIVSDKWMFLLLASAINLFASYAMYYSTGPLKLSGVSGRKYWLLSGAVVYGVGLWVSNFILLLATDSMIVIDMTSAMKLAGVVAGAYLAFRLPSSRSPLVVRLLGGSLLLTLGMSSLLYCTLLSSHVGDYRISGELSAVAILIGLCGSALSFYLIERRSGSGPLAASLVLGATGIAMQIFGLEALTIVYNVVLTTDRLSEYMQLLAIVIGMATLVIFMFSLLARRVDRRFYSMNEKYRLLVENSIDMIALIRGGRWEYVNESGLQMFEAESEADLVGCPVYSQVQPKFHAAMEQMLRGTNGDASQGPLELDWYTVKGRELHTEIVMTCTSLDGEPAFQVIVRDISERKKNEELLINSEKLYVAGQLAAGIAHEIRNPLTSLKGFLQLMASGRQGTQNYFDIMKSELNRIESIVSELLMLSKPQIYELNHRDIRQVLQHTITLLEAQALLHSIEMEAELGEEELWVYGVENQLKQVFINILKNAIEAMLDGGKIRIVCTREDQSVIVRIQDSGPGIPEEQMAKIGQPFYTTKDKGTGLGLMVTYKIVDNHSGRIRVLSSVGAGTTFEVELPYAKPPERDAQQISNRL